MDGFAELFGRTTLEDSPPVSRGKPFGDTASKAVLELRNTFDHFLFFRTICDATSGHTSGSESLVAGISDVGEATLSQLTQWLCFHGNNILYPTPFISITPDPLRAFNRAAHLKSRGYKNIEIVLIDGWNLDKANVVHCNKIREVLGLPRNNLFDTEYLVWERIPHRAVIRRWPWDTIRSTIDSLFPALSDITSIQYPQKRPLAQLRVQLGSTDVPNVDKLVSYLVDDLNLMPQNLTTKQVALMILGWSRGQSETMTYKRLEENLGRLIPDKIEELDYRLYARTCQWNLDHQRVFTQHLSQNLDSLIMQLRIARNFNIATYEDWLAERNLTEELECAEMCSVNLEEQTLLHILKSNGLDAASNIPKLNGSEFTPDESITTNEIRIDASKLRGRALM